MTEIHLTAREALERVLKAAELPGSHMLIVVLDREAENAIRDQILDRVPRAEFRAASHGLLFPNGSWITFLMARNVRPDRLVGQRIACSWTHELEALPGEQQDEWLEALRTVTRDGDAPAVLMSERAIPPRT